MAAGGGPLLVLLLHHDASDRDIQTAVLLRLGALPSGTHRIRNRVRLPVPVWTPLAVRSKNPSLGRGGYNPIPECSPLTGTSFVVPALNQGYQGISGSTRNQDQRWGHQGPSLIIIRNQFTTRAAPLGTHCRCGTGRVPQGYRGYQESGLRMGASGSLPYLPDSTRELRTLLQMPLTRALSRKIPDAS
jgi:hypothetical protein